MGANLNAPAIPPGFELEPQGAVGMTSAAPAIPPGFEIEQAPAAPAAPPRQVGLIETAGRTVASAAIPVVRAIDMAAAGLAGFVAPLLGLNPEEEQSKVFRDSEARSARMRQAYAPKAGEEMSTAGQIIGGLASAPIEVAGGFGVQRGLETAANVVERGGSVGEAALAGGVSGGANVVANLLPVKAGGAVGRAVEGVIGRGVGQRVGQVAGGALTGGGIAAAADTGVVEASNAALPEGEEFSDLRQEADPATAFGLGAAFGGAAARGARSARPAERAIAEEPTLAGADAPAGSVGAAGADVELARRERAASLPVPIKLSKGQANRQQPDQQFEREIAKNAETGGAMREHYDEQNERLAKNFDAFVDETGAEQTSRRGVGEAVESALRQKMDSRRDEIRKAYETAREAGDMAEPVKTDALVSYLNETGPESINAPVLQTVREKLLQLGGAKRDGEGGLVASEIPLNDLEEVRKMINRVSDSTPTNMTFGREIKDRIDRLTENAGGDLYREARRLRTNFAREFNDRAVINDLVRNKRGSADRAVALEDVFDRAILRRSLDDVRHLRRVLQTAGEGGQQAWRELQGQTMRHIQEQAMRGTQRDQRGNVVVSSAGLEKAIRDLDNDGRLEFIFGKKGAEQLRDLRDIAADVMTAPPGSVNSSNTSSALLNAVDTLVTFSASGLPVPAFALLRKAVTSARERGVRKKVSAALEQPAGLQPVDRSSGPRFGETVDETTGEISETPAPDRETLGAESATDPRLAEIARLRAATTNPDALDVLDRRQRKVEAEIAAGKEQVERLQRAEELDAMARGSSDPEIRRALAARAEKLRGGAIPVGEASEVPIDTVEAAGDAEIPVGEAREVTVIDAEPAPRPAEAPRSAAGSDVDVELTMLQPGAPARGVAAVAARRQAEGDMKKGGDVPRTPFKQRAELENALRAKLGNKLIDGLQKRNVIAMGEAPADVPRDAQGRFTGSTVELFHDRLDAGSAPAVLMHEVGAHYGMAKMLGDQRYAELLEDVRKMSQRPEVAKAWAQVRKAYPELDEASPAFPAEVMAHLVESAPDRPIVRRVLDGPRAYLYKNFGVNVSRVDPELVRALAVGALRKSAGVEAVSPNPAALAMAGAREDEETATQ